MKGGEAFARLIAISSENENSKVQKRRAERRGKLEGWRRGSPRGSSAEEQRRGRKGVGAAAL